MSIETRPMCEVVDRQATTTSTTHTRIHAHTHAQTYLEEIAADGVSGNWLIPSARAKAIPAAATVVRHHFFDERIRQHLCEYGLRPGSRSRCGFRLMHQAALILLVLSITSPNTPHPHPHPPGAAHERGEAPQLVNMAVGLDGRAFRDLPYPPGTTIYEVDREEVRCVIYNIGVVGGMGWDEMN